MSLVGACPLCRRLSRPLGRPFADPRSRHFGILPRRARLRPCARLRGWTLRLRRIACDGVVRSRTCVSGSTRRRCGGTDSVPWQASTLLEVPNRQLQTTTGQHDARADKSDLGAMSERIMLSAIDVCSSRCGTSSNLFLVMFLVMTVTDIVDVSLAA